VDKLVSIIVPIYNVEKYIHNCMNSILAQTLESIEIILIDDGSTDRSGEIVNQYADRFQNIKVVHKPNGGLSSARNAGLTVAEGEYIGFVDPDDWIEIDMYEKLYKTAALYNADIVMCEIIRENTATQNQSHMKIPFEYNIYKEDDIKEVILTQIIGPAAWGDDMLGSSCRNLYRREMIELNKLMFDERIRYCEDIVFNTLTFLRAKCVAIERTGLYHYQANPGSLLHSYNKDPGYVDIMLYAYNKLQEIFLKENLGTNLLNSMYQRICSGLNAMIVNTYISNRSKNVIERINKFRNLSNKSILKSVCSLYTLNKDMKQRFLCFCVKNKLSIFLFIYGFAWGKLRLKRQTILK
jgi:glycosyltransferase involved in cell wall biosynthesis